MWRTRSPDQDNTGFAKLSAPTQQRPGPGRVDAPGAVGAGPRIRDRETARHGADRGHGLTGRLDEGADWRLQLASERSLDVASLTYLAMASLDGYVEDEQGKFDWAAPDGEVHAFVNDLERPCRHPSVRAAHVQDDGLLGDRR